jgi:hypothetical protein
MQDFIFFFLIFLQNGPSNTRSTVNVTIVYLKVILGNSTLTDNCNRCEIQCHHVPLRNSSTADMPLLPASATQSNTSSGIQPRDLSISLSDLAITSPVTSMVSAKSINLSILNTIYQKIDRTIQWLHTSNDHLYSMYNSQM